MRLGVLNIGVVIFLFRNNVYAVDFLVGSWFLEDASKNSHNE